MIRMQNKMLGPQVMGPMIDGRTPLMPFDEKSALLVAIALPTPFHTLQAVESIKRSDFSPNVDLFDLVNSMKTWDRCFNYFHVFYFQFLDFIYVFILGSEFWADLNT